jgi:uncharacterized protein (DUF58 family)
MLPRALTTTGMVWLGLAACLLALSVAKGIGLLLLLSCWMVAALAWNAARCGAGLARARVAVRDDHALEAGVAGVVRVQAWLEGEGVLPARMSWPDHAGQSLLMSRSDEEAWLSVQPIARGWMPLPSAHLSGSGPYGLVEARRDILGGERVLVLPRRGRVDIRAMAAWIRQAGEGKSAMPEAGCELAVAAGEEFHGLRTWRAGDSPRLVHWRTTARTGVRMVREHEQPREESLVVLLDPTEGDDGESLVELAASVAWAWGRSQGRWLGLLVAGDRPAAIHTGASGTPVSEMLEALAHCASGEGGFPSVGPAWRRGAPVLALGRGRARIPEALQGGPARRVRPGEAGSLTWYGAREDPS